MRRRNFLIGMAGLGVLGLPGGAAAAVPAVPPGFPPDELVRYAVWREGARVGKHEVDFRRRDGILSVETAIEIAVDFLFITAYRFEHRAEEIWRAGRFNSMTSETNDNGKARRVRVERADDGLEVDYNGVASRLPGDLLPASLWHPDCMAQTALLDPTKGRIKNVTIADRGAEALTKADFDGLVPVAAESVEAHRFSIAGDLQRELWYGPDGHIWQVRFPAKDGSEITLLRH